MLILGVALGLILGLLAGGRLENLVQVRFRWLGLLIAAAAIRFGTDVLLVQGDTLVDQLRAPLLTAAYVLLLVTLFVNRRLPGIPLAFVGILGNAIAIVGNRGYAVIWEPSLHAAGFGLGDTSPILHLVVPAPIDAYFVSHFAFLGDIIPIPLPFVRNVASIGDIFLSAGLAFFLFAVVLRDTTRAPKWMRTAETGVTPALADAVALERPLVLGGTSPGMAGPSATATAATIDAGSADRASGRSTGITRRARDHPYVRLALNGSFSALWTGQLISLFGDRLNQIALTVLVGTATGSPVAVGFVFVAMTVPNLLLGPVAGTFVDRWDRKEVMVVSDLLRAALVLLIPIAAITNIILVYPMVFLITSITIFFRPARTAVLPRIVDEDDLLTANSATWISDTLADVVGYPLAGLFVAFLGRALPLAFWLDAATYIASALLIATMAVPAIAGAIRSGDTAPAEEPGADGTTGETSWTATNGATPLGRFVGELRQGWQFLRGETVLLANTLQAVVGQFTVGVLVTLTFFYARDVIQRGTLDPTAAYAFLETGIGVGNLVGGLAIGLIGARLAKGRMVIAGYALMGLCTLGLALTGNLGLAVGLMVGSGVANMVYVIPSQTLFQQRTPQHLMGRVVAFRFSLVGGSMTVAMAVSGVLATIVGVPAVIGVFGALTLAAGLAGLLVPAVRDA